MLNSVNPNSSQLPSILNHRVCKGAPIGVASQGSSMSSKAEFFLLTWLKGIYGLLHSFFCGHYTFTKDYTPESSSPRRHLPMQRMTRNEAVDSPYAKGRFPQQRLADKLKAKKRLDFDKIVEANTGPMGSLATIFGDKIVFRELSDVQKEVLLGDQMLFSIFNLDYSGKKTILDKGHNVYAIVDQDKVLQEMTLVTDGTQLYGYYIDNGLFTPAHISQEINLVVKPGQYSAGYRNTDFSKAGSVFCLESKSKVIQSDLYNFPGCDLAQDFLYQNQLFSIDWIADDEINRLIPSVPWEKWPEQVIRHVLKSGLVLASDYPYEVDIDPEYMEAAGFKRTGDGVFIRS